MLNRLGGQMVSLTGKARAMAEEALVALDAHDEEDDVVSPDIVPSSPTGFLLQALVEALSGQVEPEISSERVEVLVSQLNFARDRADVFFPNQSFSIIELLDKLSEEQSTTELLHALQTEQAEQNKLRLELRQAKIEAIEWEKEKEAHVNAQNEWTIERAELRDQLDSTRDELLDINRKIAKKQVNDDSSDYLVDSRILKSILVSLGAQVDNKPVRNSLLMIAADMLRMTPEERAKGSIPLSVDAAVSEQKPPPTLANAFLDFLEDQVAPVPEL